ncbi:MAG TPA: hypothetical protein VJH92_02410 [Candidatus Nanoarchaeia archaeon]|nr:hypothetical protein [Candidatus Nanoarchaeia archaeon]
MEERTLKMCLFCDRQPEIIAGNVLHDFGIGEDGVIEASIPQGYDSRQYGENFETNLRKQGFEIIKTQVDKGKLAYRVERRS